jgi:ACS family hexuronate transporter-like MFS transporter
MGNYRWVICALLFFATTVNYIDRQVIGILKPFIEGELGWDENDYANIVFSFQFAYAIGLLTMGRLIDWLGTKKGFSLALIFWSLAAMAHAGARTVFQFALARFALGLGEAGNFPASIKTVAEWFPKKERALATGIFNAGTNVGATVAPLMVPFLMSAFGWRAAFIATGAIGFLWLLLWIPLYHRPQEHPRLSKAELDYISSDPPDPETKVPLLKIITHKQAWAFAIAKFMTDPIWWLYLFWVPDFLKKTHNIDINSLALPLIAIYIMADVGSIGGGWLSSTLIKRGSTVNRARKTAMLICALCVTPIVLVSQAPSLWLAVLMIGLAAAAHQGWSANVFTMTSDMFPRHAVGSVVGFGGMAGAIGGMFVSKVVGHILNLTHSYVIPFIIAGSAYLLALLIVQLIVPNLEPAVIEEETAAK